jgi:hypothetical protein
MNTSNLYHHLIDIVDYFLSHTNGMQLVQLQQLDPDVGTMARILRQLVVILRSLVTAGSYDDENMAINALQCCVEMELLADKISKCDETGINEIFARLDRIVKAPVQI